MKLRLCRTAAIAAFVFCCLAGAQALAQNAYITNSGDSSVTVIDTANNKVVNVPGSCTPAICVGSGPYGIAVSRDGSKVYVSNFSSNSVSVIDTATNTVTATIGVGRLPVGVAVSPDGSKVYVANFGGVLSPNNTVSVIDAATNTVVNVPGSCTPAICVGSGPDAVAVSPDGTVYVSNFYSNSVSAIAAATNTVTATIAVGGVPEGLAVSPNGRWVYVANSDLSGSVSVIDTATNTVVNVPGSCSPAICVGGEETDAVAVTPDGSKVYVTNYQSGTVSVIATATNTLVDVLGSCSPAICVGAAPAGVSVTPDGSKVYVTIQGDNSLSSIATATNTVTNRITDPSFNGPLSFGIFIRPAPRFAGTPGFPNCHGVSVSALSTEFGGNLAAAAKALGFPSVTALQAAITAYCHA